MVKPTFICIGVQKGGTNTFRRCMKQHPDIFMKSGESHFFDVPKDKYINKKEIKDYESSFNTKKTIIGEKTPSYCYLRFAIDRIYNYNPEIKLILLLREPISRAFSQFNMGLNVNNKTLDDISDEKIMDIFKKEEKYKLSEIKCNGGYFIARGYYDEIIEYILSKFRRENIYIGISEEIRENKLKHYNDMFSFVGAKKLDTLDLKDAHIMDYKRTIPRDLELKLYKIFKPHNDRLYKLLGRKIQCWEKYYDKLK